GVSGLLACWANAPVSDFDLVHDEAVIVRALEAGCGPSGAIHVRDHTAVAADHVMMVVAHTPPIACGCTLWFDTPQEPCARKSLENVVNRLCGHRTETLADALEHSTGIGVRLLSDDLQYRDPWSGHT